jgi:dGTPase
VTALETPYPGFDGLNLSWETLEGLAKHNGPVPAPGWALAQADAAIGLELDRWPSLEAQVAALADDIAYDNHDIDDGLRAGVLTLEALLEVPLVRRHWAAVAARHPGLSIERALRALVRDQIGSMVGDLIAETERRVAAAGVGTIEGVRGAGVALVGFSDAMAGEERALKRFLYEQLYDAPTLRPVRREAQRVVAGLAAAYLAEPGLLPEGWARDGGDAQARARHVGDYVAGMTDPFAIKQHERLIGPVELPAKF